MRWGAIVSAAAAIGGIAYYLLTRKQGESRQTIVKREPLVFPEDPMIGFDEKLAEFASGLDGGRRERFFYWNDKLQEDAYVPWLEKDHPEFAATLDYIGVCLALMFDVFNQRRKGFDHPDFEVCLEETKKVFLEIVSRMRYEMTDVYPILRERRVCNSAMFLLGTILETKQVYELERKVAL